MANVVAGFAIAMMVQAFVFPLLGIRLPIATNMLMAAIFTAISIVRSFVLRRVFEAVRMRRAQRDTAAP